MNKEEQRKEATDIKESLKSIIKALSLEVKTEGNYLAEEFIKLLEEAKYDYKNPGRFDIMLNFKLKVAMEQAIQTLLPAIECVDTHKPAWIYMEYSYLTNHIRKLKTAVTGTSSSESDVARFIAGMYLQYSITGKIPETDYEEHFYKPTFGENQDWIDYCDGLYELFYGRPEKYLKAYQKLVTSPVRKYKHTLYKLLAELKTGEVILVNHRWDEEIPIPEEDYNLMPYWDIPEEKRDSLQKEEGGIFLRLPKSEIEKFYVVSEEKEI